MSSSTPRLQELTEREKETLRLLLRGHDAKSIARDLQLSVHTVNERLRDARRKLHVSSSREAARLLADQEQGSPEIHVDKNFRVAGGPSGGLQIMPAEPRRITGDRIAWLAGGMLVMSLVIATAALLLAYQGHGGSRSAALQPVALAGPSSAIPDPAATGAARQWIALLDNQQWEKSWRSAADLFKAKLSVQQWAAMVQPIRQPLGSVSSRVVQSMTRVATLPGAPDGDYEVIQFLTGFANKPGAVETVALRRESGTWKVSGYFIR